MKWILPAVLVLAIGCSKPVEQPVASRGVLKMEPSVVGQLIRPGMTRAEVLHHLGMPLKRCGPDGLLEIRTNDTGEVRVPVELWQYRIWQESGPLIRVVFSTSGSVERISVGNMGDPEPMKI